MLLKIENLIFSYFHLFHGWQTIQFTGQRSTDSILQWMLQLVNGPNSNEIVTQKQFDQLLNDNDIVLFYQGSENNINDPNY